MSYQSLLLGLGTAVTRTFSSNNRLQAETANIRAGQPIRFIAEGNNVLFGGVVPNTVYFVLEVIDSENFTISQQLNGSIFELQDGEGFMLVQSVRKESLAESLRKIDTMIKEIYESGIGLETGIQSLSEDTAPSLGGDLNIGNKNIFGNGNININGVVTAGTFRIPSYSVTQRNAILTWQNGDLIYNTTVNKIQGYQNSIWINMDGTV